MEMIGKTGHAGLKAFSRWMDRIADSAIVTLQVIDRSSSNVTVKLTVLTKNLDETTETKFTTTITGGAPGVFSEEYNDLKEQVRFMFEVADSGGEGGWIQFRALHPNFFEEQAELI